MEVAATPILMVVVVSSCLVGGGGFGQVQAFHGVKFTMGQPRQCFSSSSSLPPRVLLFSSEGETTSTTAATTTTTVTEEETTPPPLEQLPLFRTRTDRQLQARFFERRPQEVLQRDYHAVVEAAHVRHVVLETQEMAEWALESYLEGASESADPFGELARLLSACTASRHDGGRVGWITNPYFSAFAEKEEPSSPSSYTQGLIPPAVVQELFRGKPRGGTVVILLCAATNQWHLVRVDDVRVVYHSQTTTMSQENSAFSSTLNKVILPRAKLPGSGVRPQLPALQHSTNSPPLYYHVATTGCQMNVADSERLAGVLELDLGMQSTEMADMAQVVVLHTCSIRDHAEQKLYDQLGPLAARKRRGEPLALVVSGCVAQQEGEALLRRVPEIDLVMGPQYVGRLGELLQEVTQWGQQMVATEPTLQSEEADYHTGGGFATAGGSSLAAVRRSSVTAFIPVINGCDERCTYCVVPNSRLVEQSRSMEAILNECRQLAQQGYKEVTLLGQNIDAYGRDLQPRRTFAQLLHYLERHVPESIVRIRYVTSHPRYFSKSVIEAVATLPRVCECFHMPFQSGDDGVLRDMRRGYTQASYLKIIDRIRSIAGTDAAITGDVIVGFPGETPEAFQHTLDLMEAVKFDNLNTFAYSPRPYTEAATWVEDFISEEVKAERLQQVQQLALAHALERSRRYLHQEVEILVEGPNPKAPNSQVMGKTRQGRAVFVAVEDSVEEWQGKLMRVKIMEARPWSLVGEQVTSDPNDNGGMKNPPTTYFERNPVEKKHE